MISSSFSRDRTFHGTVIDSVLKRRTSAIRFGIRATSSAESSSGSESSQWIIPAPKSPVVPSAPECEPADKESGVYTIQALREIGTSIIGEGADFYPVGFDLAATMTSPAGLLRVIHTDYIAYHLWNAVRLSTEHLNERSLHWNVRAITKDAMEMFFIETGALFLDQVPGPHYILVDPRVHGNSDEMVTQAQNFLCAYEKKGVPKERIVINIPATLRGIIACRRLTSRESGVQVNLSLVSSLSHALLCVDAGATSISIPVDKVLSFFEMEGSCVWRETRPHPGIMAIQLIQTYFKLREIPVKIICNDFGRIIEIQDLAHSDAIALSEDQIHRLRSQRFPLSEPLTESSPVYGHATQVQWSHQRLTDTTKFRKRMSSVDYAAYLFVLKEILHAMATDMDSIESVVEEEIHRRMFYSTVPPQVLDVIGQETIEDLAAAPETHRPRTQSTSRPVISLRTNRGHPDAVQTPGTSRESVTGSRAKARVWFQSRRESQPTDEDMENAHQATGDINVDPRHLQSLFDEDTECF
ncbi:aldolase [Gloeophyllum trabeum ATCC 11539]|uniref:Aldolase n=1 Tax=Gloeophyllum trabeum (strain ATCC 11539 / FP-39264 / Madison 617) TaxID=670483 RepID=S7R8Y9_GLOTA|nr:aldolase [Gloeophyllum trabeum ATCC 11539]EPQ50775.1 aldolase [Gloeophyllum trabeum ATCC 11539]